jgi:hypothetical protein
MKTAEIRKCNQKQEREKQPDIKLNTYTMQTASSNLPEGNGPVMFAARGCPLNHQKRSQNSIRGSPD